jgi:hypothetical protein
MPSIGKINLDEWVAAHPPAPIPITVHHDQDGSLAAPLVVVSTPRICRHGVGPTPPGYWGKSRPSPFHYDTVYEERRLLPDRLTCVEGSCPWAPFYYRYMLMVQDGRSAICGQRFRLPLEADGRMSLVADHDQTHGARGLIQRRENSWLAALYRPKMWGHYEICVSPRFEWFRRACAIYEKNVELHRVAQEAWVFFCDAWHGTSDHRVDGPAPFRGGDAR